MSDITDHIRSATADNSVMESARQRYKRLCELRDAANKKCEPLKARLDVVNQRAEKARQEAQQIALEIQTARGGAQAWLALKREIGQLASMIMNMNMKRSGTPRPG